MSMTYSPLVSEPFKQESDLESRSLTQVQFSLHHHIDEISNWDQAAPPDNLFLQKDFLKTLELAPPSTAQSYYLTYQLNGSTIGVALCQLVPFQVFDNINLQESLTPSRKRLKKLRYNVRKALAKKLSFNLLICGNLLLTGEHGHYFSAPYNDPKTEAELLDMGLNFAKKQLAIQGKHVDAALLKDFFDSQELDQFWSNKSCTSYNHLSFQPNMILKFRENWLGFEDYLADMSSKYRVRAKRARKKGKDIQKKVLSYNDIQLHEKEIHQLYLNIANKVGFNMFELHPQYWTNIKQQLGPRFEMVGYYLEDRLIGFYTYIINNGSLEAHFLGYQEAYNPSHLVYQNMLYDLVEQGFQNGASEVILGRTALEIKSSIGAEAHEMHLYLRHNKPLPKKVVQFLVNYFEPKTSWTPRSPFK